MNNIIDSIQLSGTTYQIQGGSIAVDTELDSGSTNPVQNKVIYNKIDEVEQVTAAGLNALDAKINPTVELTQAQYDALVSGGTVDPNTYYIITDAEAGDLTNYYTKSETNTLLNDKADTATTYTKTEVDTALNGKQATLVSGTNIKTINNTSILGSGNIDIQGGGGGKAVSGGTNISITTGETADTINCTLPITASSRSIICSGYNNELLGQSNDSIIAGRNNILYNYATAAFGHYNICSQENSSSNFGYSGNTLFSIGNGKTQWLRHNALDIRDNGDIYIADTNNTSTTNYYEKPMIKLQDALEGGGGGITIDPSLDSGSTNAVANSAITTAISTVSAATSSNTTALGGLSLVKLTQSEYDALSPNYDSNTLYVIT